MGRISVLGAIFLIASALRASAQSDAAAFEFVENKGQWHNNVRFRGELGSGSFYLQQKGFMVTMHHPDDLRYFMDNHRHDDDLRAESKKSKKIDYTRDMSGTVTDGRISKPERTIRSHAYTVEFVGANEQAEIVPDKPVPSYNNYFLGDDPTKWASHVKIYRAVLYKNIYPNIDVRYYSENDKLKYDLIIHPGGDPSQIALRYTGPDKIQVKNNELIIKTSVGDVKELYPYSFQPDNIKGRKKVECQYALSGNTVRFRLGEYSKNSTLVIDPSLVFVSFTGSRADEFGFTATPGPDGSLFAGGIVFGDGYPVTPGAYQRSFAGGGSAGTDIGIMKFSSNGSQRLYATYIGGNENEYPHSLFSDPQGNLVVMGRSYSANYPRTAAPQGPSGGGNIIVTKLNSTGSGVIGSLIIGGSGLDGVNFDDVQRNRSHRNISLLRNYGDDSRSEVILDWGGFIYVAAQTQSDDFPIRGGGFQPAHGGKQDGVVMKIDPTCNALVWSSYLGGPGDDGAFVLDINPANGNIYVGGGTTTGSSADGGTFPGVAGGVIGPSFHGGETDAFVSIISNNGQTLIRSTYLGTSNVDIIYGLKFDRKGFPYIMGVSRGGNWPVVNATYSVPGSSQFIAKLQPDLSAFEYSTVFGSGSARPNMSPVAFLVDRCENVYVSGWGGWISFSERDAYDQAGVAGMPVTADAVKSTTDNKDFYFIVIQKNASALIYGTFFGQTRGAYGEHVDGGTSRYDQQGTIYQAICANCSGGARFPTTPGVVGPVNGSNQCNLAAVKMAFNYAGVASGPRAYFNNVPDTMGCAPFTVNLRDTILNARSYEWDFDGDGTTDSITTATNLDYTFQNIGIYRVRLIAVDSNTCNERDTAYLTIRVGDERATLAMDVNKIGQCEELNYRFDNLSTYTNIPFTDTSFTWDFGDGSPRVRAGSGSVTHAYAQPGTYFVRLVLDDTTYCNSPDSIEVPGGLRVNPLVKAQFETPLTGCAPYDAVFVNTSLAGETFQWDFGDGSTSADVNPVHTYQNPGTYTVRLTAFDPGTCNLVDDTAVTIVVSSRPTAAFTYTPVVPVQNTPHIFNNLSTGAVRYKWLFGDGDSVIKTTRDTVLHQYNVSGQFEAMLIAYNEFGCTDTARDMVTADILPLFDVPNAFTPGRFGRNSVIMVEGFGITRMAWTIYNRWGQKVFETNNRKAGWDGTHNGKPLPMDVYAYTLDVEFFDGQRARKTGDITLIR